MNPSIRRFSLDVNASRSQISIPVVRGDTSRIWHITLTDGGISLPLTECAATLSIKRPNGSYVEDFACIIADERTIVYDFSWNQKTAIVEGVHECEVTIYGADGSKLTSAKFTMIVSERAVESDDLEVTDDDRTIIDGIIAKEAERQVAETERQNAEAERQNAEVERQEGQKELIQTITQAKECLKQIEIDSGDFTSLNEAVEYLQPLFDLRASEQERQENEEQRQMAEAARVEAYTKNEELVGVYTTKVDSLEKRVNNFENVSGGYIYDEIVDSSNAYAKTISAKVLPTGFVNRLGGLSRSSDNIMPYNDFTLGYCEKVSENTYYRGGVTFRHNGDGTITLTGTSQDIGQYTNALGLYADNLVIPKGRYVIGLDVDGEDNIGVFFYVGYKDSSSSSYAFKAIHPNRYSIYDIAHDMPYVNIQIQISRKYIGNTIAKEGLTLKPYILRLDDREGEIKAYHFTPYYDGYKHAKVTSIISADENGESIDEYTIPKEIQALDGYGLGISKDVCNYIDFEAKTYTQMVALGADGVPYELAKTIITDVSAYLPAQRCALKIADGGTVTFVNEDEARATSELTFLEVLI